MRAVSSRLAIFGTLLASALCAAFPATAQQSYESQGLKASIGEITRKDGQNLSVQLLLTNTTKFKKYTIFARNGADGSLSNGDVMAIRNVVGLPACTNTTKEGCAKNTPDPVYIEAGSSVSVILWYWDQSGKLPPSGKISFPMRLVVQTASETDDVVSGGASREPGQPSLVVINFTQIPLQ
jgi:hypothetical protein